MCFPHILRRGWMFDPLGGMTIMAILRSSRDVDLVLLRTFLAVLDYGSLRKAAETLNITQAAHHHETDPTVAGSIGRLEVRLLGDDSEMSSMVSVIEGHPKFVPLAIVNGVLWIISKNVFVA